MQSTFAFNEMVSYRVGPGGSTIQFGTVVSPPLGLADVPALGTFYLVQTPSGPQLMQSGRLSHGPGYVPGPPFVRRSEFDA